MSNNILNCAIMRNAKVRKPNCNIKCDKHMDKKNVPCDDKPSTKIVQKIAERKK
jgi:hypothetical protein